MSVLPQSKCWERLKNVPERGADQGLKPDIQSLLIPLHQLPLNHSVTVSGLPTWMPGSNLENTYSHNGPHALMHPRWPMYPAT